MNKKNSITISLITLIVVLCLGALAFYVSTIRAVLVEETESKLVETAEQMSAQIEYKIHASIASARLLGVEATRLDNLSEKEILEQLQAWEVYTKFSHIMYVDGTGTLYGTTCGPDCEISEEDFSDLKALRLDLRTHQDEETGKRDSSITISLPIREGNTITGTLVCQVYTWNLLNEVHSHLFDGVSYFYLVNNEGLIVSNPKAELVGSNIFDMETSQDQKIMDSLKNMKRRVEENESGSMIHHFLEYKRYAGFAPINSSYGLNDLNVVASFRYDIATHEMNELIKYSLIMLAVFSLIAFLIVIYIVYILKRKEGQLKEKNVLLKRDLHSTKRMARLDPLTGVYNKVEAREMINQALLLSKLEKDLSGNALFMIDVDDFKTLNDTLGHATGDMALVEFTKKLKHLCRESDIVGRIGGDEFVLFFKNTKEEEIIRRKAEELCREANVVYEVEGKIHPLTISIGIAVSPDHGTDFDSLYAHADRALQRAKLNGKSRFMVCPRE